MTLHPNIPRVLIIHSGSLLSAGLISLFTGDAELDVMVIAPLPLEVVYKTVRNFHPAVIIFDDASLRIGLAPILSLPHHYPDLKLVQVSVDQDVIRVHGESVFHNTQKEQLLTLVKSPPNQTFGLSS